MITKGRKKVIGIVLLSLAILLLFAFGALMAVSGIFERAHYLKPWAKSYSATFTDPRVRLLAHGLLAPSGHNMQPWTVRLDPEQPQVFYLYADSGRLSEQADPEARQLMISQGTFLEYIRTAAQKSGYEASITLFPDGAYDERELIKSMRTKPVAAVSLAEHAPFASPFYDYIFLPDTNRGAYLSDSITTEQAAALQAAGKDGGVVRVLQNPADVRQLGELAVQGAITEAGTGRVMQEAEKIFRPNEREKNKYRYGFSVEGQGSNGLMKHILQGIVTLFPSMNSGQAASDQMIRSTEDAVHNTPAYAMIVTADNSRVSQVKSGMAYSRMILAAHHAGLALQPLSQVLEEYEEMGELYNSIHRTYAPGGGIIQMLVRVGKPEKQAPHSMRRDVMDLVAAGAE